MHKYFSMDICPWIPFFTSNRKEFAYVLSFFLFYHMQNKNTTNGMPDYDKRREEAPAV